MSEKLLVSTEGKRRFCGQVGRVGTKWSGLKVEGLFEGAVERMEGGLWSEKVKKTERCLTASSAYERRELNSSQDV